MWWKLGPLFVITALLVVAMIPIRTRAVVLDPLIPAPHSGPAFGDLVRDMYLTPASASSISAILIVASLVAWRTVRAGR